MVPQETPSPLPETGRLLSPFRGEVAARKDNACRSLGEICILTLAVDALSNLREAAELHIEEVGILGKAGITIERLEEGGHIMTVQEKLERLKREKTAHSTGELDRLGWARYAEIRSRLEDQHHGAYVMIEVDSGDCFVGETPQAALCQARAAYPGKAFYLIRIGYKAVHKLKRT